MTSLRGKERSEFSPAVRKARFRFACRPDGMPKCEAPGCGLVIRAGHLRYEHFDPDGLGGEPSYENCRVYCDVCARKKDRIDNPRMAKADRVTRKTYGLTPRRQKIAGRGFEKRAPQRTASRPVNKFRGF